jgi:hypothetical protein
MNTSEENAQYQYIPFGRPLQHLPALWVGRSSALKLRELTASAARATLTLEADVIPNTPTDTTKQRSRRATTWSSSTPTDGPNSTEETAASGAGAGPLLFTAAGGETPHDGLRARDRPFRRGGAVIGRCRQATGSHSQDGGSLDRRTPWAMDGRTTRSYRATGKPF